MKKLFLIPILLLTSCANVKMATGLVLSGGQNGNGNIGQSGSACVKDCGVIREYGAKRS